MHYLAKKYYFRIFDIILKLFKKTNPTFYKRDIEFLPSKNDRKKRQTNILVRLVKIKNKILFFPLNTYKKSRKIQQTYIYKSKFTNGTLKRIT